MIIGLLAVCTADGQHALFSGSDSLPYSRVLDGNKRIYKSTDTTWIYSGICKPLKRIMYTGKGSPFNNNSRPNNFSIHGNVQYDFLYRSLVDTPFYQKDFQQHSIKTNFSLLFKNTYPVQVTVLHRSSNSPFFRDITDVSVQFRHKDYLNKLKENLLQQATRNFKANYQLTLDKTESLYKNKLAEISALEQWLASPARLQELVAERERRLKQLPQNNVDSALLKLKAQVPGANNFQVPQLPDEEAIRKALEDKLKHRITAEGDSILAMAEAWAKEKKQKITDSLLNTQTAAFIEKKKKELADMKKDLAGYEKRLKGVKKNIADSLLRIKQEVMALKDPASVKNFIAAKKLSLKEMPKGWQSLMAIRSIGIGRTWVDYSELTVKNISLTGGNIELNSGNLYFAAAAGRINYRFRDFVLQNTTQPKQSLYLVRAGVGKKDGNNLIFTWYDGKRSLLDPFNSVNNAARPERVIGMSVETGFRISQNQSVVAEFAKSSFHNTGNVSADGPSLFNKVKNFKDHSNEAYSIKLNSYWPMAALKISGYYKKMGEHFQSFNLQPVNSVQEAFQIKVQQQLWKKKLTIDAGIRKNDFSNPFINPGISSSTVFKSLQLSVRIPKYPYLTIGYAPSSQLTVIDNQRIAENQYNTLNGVVGYSYKVKKIGMVTNAMFLKFYNNTPDTGFIYYNASSFALNQFFYLGGWQLQSGLTITHQQDIHVLTLEQSATWQLKQWLSLTAGLKYNRLNHTSTDWSSTAGMNMIINKIGTIQMSYDKSYLPGTNRDLMPVQMGRVTYYKSF